VHTSCSGCSRLWGGRCCCCRPVIRATAAFQLQLAAMLHVHTCAAAAQRWAPSRAAPIAACRSTGACRLQRCSAGSKQRPTHGIVDNQQQCCPRLRVWLHCSCAICVLIAIPGLACGLPSAAAWHHQRGRMTEQERGQQNDLALCGLALWCKVVAALLSARRSA
jgi:hypothetical protein